MKLEVVVCDRCEAKIEAEPYRVRVGRKRTLVELCPGCADDLAAFLKGGSLKVSGRSDAASAGKTHVSV